MKSKYENMIKGFKDVIFNNNEGLSKDELKKLKDMLIVFKENIESNEELLMEFGRLLDYDTLLKKGKTNKEIKEYYELDNDSINTVKKDYINHIDYDHNHMFGYPANMMEDSHLVSYYRWLESQMYFMNSCGDAYHPGNYRMNNNKAEIEIIEEIKKNLNLSKDKYWGYINAGGTEGNFWGLREGLSKYNNGIVYCSTSSHYSVDKFLEISKPFKIERISTNKGAIDVEHLINKIELNYKKDKAPAILFLTCGTTTLGSVDDVETIKEQLVKLNIPHYIHLDAALYGGIPNNQENSPTTKLFENLNDLDIDSISISLHKYLGNSRVNGVLLSQSQINNPFISYIGQNDVTFLGSRDFPAYSTLQRIKEIYGRSSEGDYYKNIRIFENLLNDRKINYIKGDEYGNTFVIDMPSDEICKKYQLSTFLYNDKPSAHIIIFPYHKLEYMEALVNDISKNKIKNKIR